SFWIGNQSDFRTPGGRTQNQYRCAELFPEPELRPCSPHHDRWHRKSSSRPFHRMGGWKDANGRVLGSHISSSQVEAGRRKRRTEFIITSIRSGAFDL